jgi:pyruvate dehydrogenase E2 component (dihydrolipoamide acetyltransferase)
VPVGSVLVVLELRDAADAGAPAPVAAPLAPAPAVVTPPVSDGSGGPVGNLDEVLPGMASARDDRGGAAQGEGVAGQPLAAPATRRRARELGVDLRQVPPTGKAGRSRRRTWSASRRRNGGEAA